VPSVHYGPVPWPTSGAHRSLAFDHSRGQGHQGRGRGVEEAEVSTFVGSSELGRLGNGGAAERDDRQRLVLDAGVFRCGRGGERDSEWCRMLRGGGSPFIGARGGRRAAIMAGIGGETGSGVNGNFKRL
jgi:hypothetical protein